MIIITTAVGDGSQHPDYHHCRGALLFHIRFKCAADGPGWKCRGCVVMIVMITAADAEDA